MYFVVVCMEGFMEIFKGLIGNEDIKNTLGSAILKGEFSHAYIIEGPYGSGKHTIARLASASIMCENRDTLPCKSCNLCQKILNDSCTDVRFYDAFKVEDVRKIKSAIYESATECEYQIFILNDAHKMTVQAQNALLLSLEEPPKNVVFFLLCTDASLLLETIRSRAQILRTKPLSKEQMLGYIKRNVEATVPSESLEEIVVSASGSLGYALDLLDPEKAQALVKSRTQAENFVTTLLNLDTGVGNLLYSMFSWQRERVKDLLSCSLVVLRDLAVVKRSKNAPLCFYTSHENATLVASKYSLKKILGLIDAISIGIDNLGVNASVAGTLTSILASCK